jgi:hypothetical protein
MQNVCKLLVPLILLCFGSMRSCNLRLRYAQQGYPEATVSMMDLLHNCLHESPYVFRDREYSCLTIRAGAASRVCGKFTIADCIEAVTINKGS